MAFDTMTWATAQTQLPPSAKLVLIVLAEFQNSKTKQCNPCQKTIASRCNLSVSAINRHLRLLEDLGLIRRKRRFSATTGATLSTQYVFPKAPKTRHSKRRAAAVA